MIWITETGYSTWRHDERRQLQAFIDAIAAPMDRIYWYSAYNLDPELPHQEGFHADEGHYHFGFKHANGTSKLPFLLAANAGLAALHDVAWLGDSAMPRPKKRYHVLITGGAGFIGANAVDRILTAGQSVLVFENLSRQGVDQNLRWLRQRHGDRLEVEVADIRDLYALRRAVSLAEQVYHFAAQVAVTTSLTNPVLDFEINACGSINLLEVETSRGCPYHCSFCARDNFRNRYRRRPLSVVAR